MEMIQRHRLNRRRAYDLAIWVMLLGLLLLPLADPLKASSSGLTSPEWTDAGLRLLKSDDESIILELYTPAFQLAKQDIGETTYDLLSVPGYGLTSEEGRPQLPLKGVMLGVPPEATLEAHVLEAELNTEPGQYNIYPVPKVTAHQEPDEPFELLFPFGRSTEKVFAKDEALYSTDGFYPRELVEIASSGYLRDQRFVALLLHPFQYNPVTGELRFYKRLQVALRLGSLGGSRETEVVGEVSGPFEEVLENILLNYDSAMRWRGTASVKAGADIQGMNPPASQLSWKVAVDQDGIYQLTYNDLLDAGIDVDNVDPHTFRLYSQGSEVAIYVEGEDDDIFNTNDYILFYGQKVNTKYTDTNTYWLIYDGAEGQRMAQKDGDLSGSATPVSFEDTTHLGEDIYYVSWAPMVEGADHWYWNYVYPPSIPSQTYTFTLTHMVSNPYTGTFRAKIHAGISHARNPDHHTRIYLNGNLLEDAYWDGLVERNIVIDIPSSYLLDGTNTILLEDPNDTGVGYDVVHVNWFEIEYQHTYTAENDQLRFGGENAGTWEYHVDGFTTDDIEVFDITDPATVSGIINTTVEPGSSYTLKFEDTTTDRREYLALTTAQRLSPLSIVQDTSSDLHSTSNGADYIIITHSDFQDEVLPLVNRRAGQGLRTIIVDVQDIYDEFSYGVFDAQAIHDFLAYAYANWQAPAPSYVLLVGDGTYDFKDNLGTGTQTYIPPYLAMVDPYIGETASDSRCGMLNGDDLLADMFIGRLPVNSTDEASTVVSKILNYEQNPPSGDWNKKVLFAADNADAAGDFDDLSDDIADNYLPPSYIPDKVYLGINYPYENPAVQAKAALMSAFNEGRLLVHYIGHASHANWTWEGLFGRSDIPSLTNGEKLPMMLPMTCWEGYFIDPLNTCLSESIVRAEGKGAIASWSATGLGLAHGHDYLDKGFFTAVFTDNISEIGPATYLGKLNLYTETGGETSPFRDLMDTYVLFGDPFMKLNLPACDAADYDNDGRITVADVMQVAAHWDTEWGDANFDRKYDLDDDGDVDIVDVMWVAGRWEEVC